MADSIVIIVLIFGIALFGTTYLALTHAENGPIAAINTQIDSRLLTIDSANCLNWLLNLWRTLPIFFCFGLILFMYERAKGTDLPASMFFEYEVLMLVATTFSLLLAWAWSLSIDAIFGALASKELTSNVGFQWDRSEVVSVLIRLTYLGVMIPGIIGTFLYIIHPVIRQTDNTFFENKDENSTINSDEYVTPYQLQQF